jgi:hypothetical protein
MIQYIEQKNINRIKWDALIDKALNRRICAYSWYLDLICKEWDAVIEDDYISVMPVTKGRKFFITYLYQPVCAQQLGIFSSREITSSLVDSFLKTISDKFNYIDISLNYDNVCSFEGFSRKEMINYELKLNDPYPDIRMRFKLDTRWQVKKSFTYNLHIEKSKDILTTISMFKKNKGHIYANIKQRDYDILQRFMETLIMMNKAEVWYVKDEQNIIMAGAFFLIFEGQIVFLFSGRTEEARKNKAMYFLCNKIIEEYSGRNITFDFAGSNDPGVGNFYKSFGAEEKKYFRVRKNTLPFFLKWLKK